MPSIHVDTMSIWSLAEKKCSSSNKTNSTSAASNKKQSDKVSKHGSHTAHCRLPPRPPRCCPGPPRWEPPPPRPPPPPPPRPPPPWPPRLPPPRPNTPTTRNTQAIYCVKHFMCLHLTLPFSLLWLQCKINLLTLLEDYCYSTAWLPVFYDTGFQHLFPKIQWTVP